MNQFDFLSLSPVHVLEHTHRLESIRQLKENISGTIKTVEKYAAAGADLCTCIGKLGESFTCYNEFQSDPAIRSITDLLQSWQSIFENHYSQVVDHIVTPLRRFMNEEIYHAEEAGKRAERDVESYMKMLDLYVSQNRKKVSEVEQEERDGRLMAAHWQAVNSDFEYERQLSLVERKKLIDVTAIFLFFLNLASVSYKQCMYESEAAKENFTELQLSLPESTRTISNYVSQTTLLNQSLLASHGLFWKRMTLQFPGTGSLEHQGYLWKRSSGFTKSWKRRYFVCKDHELSYYHGIEDRDKPRGTLPLLLTSVKPLDDSDRRFCFTIISQSKTYVVQALTEWDMNEWMNVIRNNIQYLLDHSSPDETDEEKALTETNNPLHLECNKKCADCGASCPTWCCINWGTCICIRCSGVHREMSILVSKVRSLTLDRMERSVVALMQQIGNERANEILEATLKDEERIRENCSRDERTAFLRRKYIECAFVDTSEVVDTRKAIEDGNVLDVFRGLCQMKKANTKDDDLLKFAAACGDPVMCFLVGLNTQSVNTLDSGGWSALSYAAYYGNHSAAEALISLGCDPSCSPAANPYAIAYSGLNQGLATLFLPYWHGPDSPNGDFTPPIRINTNSRANRDGNQTLTLIGQVNSLI